MRFERRTRSCWSSSASRDHSRSSITLGSPASTRRNRCRSVRNPAAATRASRRSSLAPATLMRSRSRSSCLGLIAYTAKPRSSKASTTGPCGTSIATATEPGSPAADASQSHRAAKPAPPCANSRSPTTLPASSSRHTWCFAEPQSTPANQCIVPSAMVLSSRVPRAVTTPAGTCMGDPRSVLVARVHGWSLPAGRLARSAYTRLDRALPGYRCTDRLAGAEELGGVGERPFLALDAYRAVQAEPGLPPPYPSTAAQGHELAGLRRQLTAAGQPDGVVHRGGGRRVGGRAPHDPGRAALVFGARHPDGPDRARRVPSGVPADRRPDRLHYRPARLDAARAGPHHPEPAGRNGGRAAAAATQPRGWGRGRALAPVGGQHGAQAVWTRRMADRETRDQDAPILAQIAPWRGRRDRPDRRRRADHQRRG